MNKFTGQGTKVWARHASPLRTGGLENPPSVILPNFHGMGLDKTVGGGHSKARFSGTRMSPLLSSSVVGKKEKILALLGQLSESPLSG